MRSQRKFKDKPYTPVTGWDDEFYHTRPIPNQRRKPKPRKVVNPPSPTTEPQANVSATQLLNRGSRP